MNPPQLIVPSPPFFLSNEPIYIYKVSCILCLLLFDCNASQYGFPFYTSNQDGSQNFEMAFSFSLFVVPVRLMDHVLTTVSVSLLLSLSSRSFPIQFAVFAFLFPDSFRQIRNHTDNSLLFRSSAHAPPVSCPFCVSSSVLFVSPISPCSVSVLSFYFSLSVSQNPRYRSFLKKKCSLKERKKIVMFCFVCSHTFSPARLKEPE